MRLKSQTEQRLVDLLHDKKFSAFVSKLGKPKSTIEDDLLDKLTDMLTIELSLPWDEHVQYVVRFFLRMATHIHTEEKPEPTGVTL